MRRNLYVSSTSFLGTKGKAMPIYLIMLKLVGFERPRIELAKPMALGPRQIMNK